MKVSLLPFATALAAFSADCFADNLLQNASFEQPVVEGRTPENPRRANPAVGVTETSWAHLQSVDKAKKLVVGLTNEIARTGKQSLYVDFAKAAENPGAFLMTDLIPITGSEQYRVSIWGRVDRTRPLTLDQRRPLLRLEVEYFQADQGTQSGDTETRVQLIPGSPDRLLFLSNRWNEFSAKLKSPNDAAFMKVTFRWVIPPGEGEADGLIFFDDAVVEGAKGALKSSADPAPLPGAGSSTRPQDPAVD